MTEPEVLRGASEKKHARRLLLLKSFQEIIKGPTPNKQVRACEGGCAEPQRCVMVEFVSHKNPLNKS